MANGKIYDAALNTMFFIVYGELDRVKEYFYLDIKIF